MSCMEKCSRADIGFQLMTRMREEGIEPNVHIYNSAISACARSNLWEKGYELFQVSNPFMIFCYRYQPQPSWDKLIDFFSLLLQEMDKNGVRKDVVTYNAGVYEVFL